MIDEFDGQWYSAKASRFGSESTDGAESIPTLDLSEFGEENVDVRDAEIMTPYGFTCLPPAGSQVYALSQGGIRRVIAAKFENSSQIYGNLSQGDVAIYSAGQNAIRMLADGKISFIQKGANGVKDTALTMGDDGKVSWLGPNIAITADEDGLNIFHTPSNHGIRIDAQGVHVFGAAINLSGGSISLGSAAAKPMIATVATPLVAPTVFV
mgnify:CR=1 FL=1